MFKTGDIEHYLGSLALFVVIVPTAGALLVGFKRHFILSVTSIWEKNVDNQTLDKSVQFWKAVKKYSAAYGLIGTVIGLITILRVEDLENLEGLGSTLTAVALLTVFYGLFQGYMVADPIACSLETKKEVTEP